MILTIVQATLKVVNILDLTFPIIRHSNTALYWNVHLLQPKDSHQTSSLETRQSLDITTVVYSS